MTLPWRSLCFNKLRTSKNEWNKKIIVWNVKARIMKLLGETKEKIFQELGIGSYVRIQKAWTRKENRWKLDLIRNKTLVFRKTHSIWKALESWEGEVFSFINERTQAWGLLDGRLDGDWLPGWPTSWLEGWNFQPHPLPTLPDRERDGGLELNSPSVASDLINHA